MKSALTLEQHLALPSLAGQVAAALRKQESVGNVKDHLHSIRAHIAPERTKDNLSNRMKVCSVGAVQLVFESVCGSELDYVVTALTVAISDNQAHKQNVSSYFSSSVAYYELSHELCVDIQVASLDSSNRDYRLQQLRESLISRVISSPKFGSFLKGHSVDALLVDTEREFLDCDLPCQAYTVRHANDSEVFNFIDGITDSSNLLIYSHTQLHNQLIRSGATGVVGNVIVFDNYGRNLAYLGERSREELVKPYFVTRVGTNDDSEAALRLCLPQHWVIKEAVTNNDYQQLSKVFIRSDIEAQLFQYMNEAEQVWLSGLDDF